MTFEHVTIPEGKIHQIVKQYLSLLEKEVVLTDEQWALVGKTEGMLAVIEENKNVRTEVSLQFARFPSW